MARQEQQYDVVVIGAGSGGLTAAIGAAKVGKKTLLIERDQMGGECTNAGCIPSKALLHHAKAYRDARTVAGGSTQSETYRKEAFRYVHDTIEAVRAEETPERLHEHGVTVVLGEAVFTSQFTVRVGDVTYRYRHAIIATGSRPKLIDIPGLDPRQRLTNETLFQLPDVPARTLVIGSGPIGMEMGQAFALLGSRVTIATIDQELARLEDPALRPIITEQFKRDGIWLIHTAYIDRVEQGEAIFNIKPHGSDGQTTHEERVPFDVVLIAIGREPNLPAGLEAAGIRHNHRAILVDDQYRTSNRTVYAVGDVAQMLKFTHTADDAARQVITRIASHGWLRVNTQKAVPKVTYTEPEMAQVGLSWDMAVERFGETALRRITVPLTAVDRARTDNAGNGQLVVIARVLTGEIVGAHYAGPRAGELIAIFTLAIDQHISLWRLRRTIFAYPTYALIVKKAADLFFAEQLANLSSDLKAMLVRHVPKLIAGALWLTLLFILYRYQADSGRSVLDTALAIFDFVSTTAWGPVLYILAYTVRPLTFFPGTALTILSGVFFGFWLGTLYTIVAANLSATVAYLVGRFFGHDLRLEHGVLGRFVTGLRNEPFVTTLVMRMIFLPFDVVSYFAGILKLPFLPYLLATVVGTLLGIATFVAIGASLDLETVLTTGLTFSAINPQFILLSVIIFAISLGLSRLLRRKRSEV